MKDSNREAFEVHIKSTYPMGEQLAKDCGKTLCELYSSEWKAWQAAKAQAVPGGFVLVPKEPTSEMLYCGYAAPDNLAAKYKAMIEAAQEPAND